MTVTAVTARLLQSGYSALDLTEYLSQETVPEITDAFEKPAETNAFVAPDVTIVGRDDASLTVTNRLRLLSPTGGDNTFEIWRGTLRMFAGAIAPNTVSFDEQERSFTFTAFGLAKRLAEIDATPMFKRTANLTGWTVVSSDHVSLTVTKSGATSCPFYGGDTLAIVVPAMIDPVSGLPVEGSRNELTISQVIPLGSSQWQCSADVSEEYAAGASVELVTDYIRGASVEDVVTECFTTAIPGATVQFLTSTPGEVGDFFASPLPTTGLGDLPFSVVTAPSLFHPIAVTAAGAYELTNAPSAPWTFVAYTNNQPAVSWLSNGGTGRTQLYGDLWDYSVSGPISARSTTYTYFAYNYGLDGEIPTCKRWLLQITTSNVPDTSGVYSVDIWLREQTSVDGKSWSGYSTPSGWLDGSYGTNTDLRPYLVCGAHTGGVMPKSVGITYGTFARALFLTVPKPPVMTDGPVAFGVYSFAIDTGVLTLLQDGTRGVPVMFDGATLLLFALDGLDDPYSGDVNAPHVTGYLVPNPATMAPFGNIPVPASVAWPTVGGQYIGASMSIYMMGGSIAEGAYLLRIVLPGGSTAPYIVTSMITPPGAGVNTSALGLCANFDPMTNAPRFTALVGNSLWWVAAASSEVIDYLDCDGLTLADLVSQCALLTDAVWYVDVSGATPVCWYRSRQIASGAAYEIGALDDGGLLSLKTQPLWYRTYRYVEVTNERDDTVNGAAGDSGYRNGTMALSLTPRYAYPTSFCYAIARHTLSYLGRGLEFLDLTHEDDGRAYQIGRTFTLPARRPGKTYQITEVQRPALAGTVRVQAVEL